MSTADRARRKARGVFYTPAWLADEIIEETLSRARARFGDRVLDVLDPACGDGAFTRRVPRDGARIHGIDVDPVALSLAGDDVQRRCGDAIVDSPLPGLSPLVWDEAFPRVMAEGGFHAVVGNPPYRNMDAAQAGDEPADFARLKRWLQTFRSEDPRRISWAEHYRRMCDLYHLFIVRGLWALQPGGVLGFVTSRTWLEAWYADSLRRHLLEHTVLSIRDLGDEAVFEGTAIPACVLVVAREKPSAEHRIEVRIGTSTRSVRQSELDHRPWRFRARPVPGALRLGDLCDCAQGMQTGANRVFTVTPEVADRLELEPAWLRRRAVGRDIQAGRLLDSKRRYALWTEDSSEVELPTAIAAWLQSQRSALEARAAFKRGDCEWYRWSWPRPGQLGRPKILCPYRARSNRFYLDSGGDLVGLTDTTVLLPRRDMPATPDDLVRRLNDAEHTRRQLERGKRTGQGLVEYFAVQLAELPVNL